MFWRGYTREIGKKGGKTMAEFVEVIKNKNRMCDRYKGCHGCPLALCNNRKQCTCYDFVNTYTKEAEEIILKWAEQHPVLTNADKFKEVFGFFPNEDACPHNTDYCKEKCPLVCYPGIVFWKQEYKAPDKEGEE